MLQTREGRAGLGETARGSEQDQYAFPLEVTVLPAGSTRPGGCKPKECSPTCPLPSQPALRVALALMILCSELPVAGSIQAMPPVKQGTFSFRLKAMALHDYQAQQLYFQVLAPQDSGLLEILDPPQTPCSEISWV